MVSKPSFVVSTYSYIPINEINKFSLVNFSMYKYCFNEQLVPFIAILTTTTTLLLWKKPWAWNGERKHSSILICWPINWVAHMNLQPAVLQKFTLWHSGEHLPQKSTPFLICWLCICCPLHKPHLCFLPIACNTHTHFMSPNRKQKVREVHFHQHGRVSLAATLSLLCKSLLWKEGEQSLKRCHQKMATAAALKVCITTLIWCLALL